MNWNTVVGDVTAAVERMKTASETEVPQTPRRGTERATGNEGHHDEGGTDVEGTEARRSTSHMRWRTEEVLRRWWMEAM